MFEFDKYTGPDESPTRPTSEYAPLPMARERAFLVWSEHCVECAAPDCFSSCDLYDPRPDRRCRRFVHGTFRNSAFPSASGFGAEVRFKQWGKIEARGNATMLPTATVARMERTSALAAKALDPVGRLAGRVTGDIRWSYVSFALLERHNRRIAKQRDPARCPDFFVAELYNPTTRPVELTLGISVDRAALGRALTADQVPQAFSRRLVVPPGYFLEAIPLVAFAAIVESGLPFNVALTPTVPDAHLVFLTLDFVAGQVLPAAVAASATAPVAPSVDASATPASERPAAKCVVFDLDNTLWDGILVEGKVVLRPGVLELFSALDKRGILISVASKNAHGEALDALRAFRLEEFVLFPHISWGPKSQSLKGIAQAIDIGIDTLVFVDDNAFERAEVAQALPAIETLPDTALSSLLAHPRLQGSQTAEAANRRLMYRESMERAAAEIAFGDDYIAFLKSCEIRVEIRPDRPEDIDRVAELVQRTNQLNFSGRKYTRNQMADILANQDIERYVLSVDDRYGSYGTVGFCMVRKTDDTVFVQDFMLSCRVQGKFVEQALFHHLTQRPGWIADVIEIDFVRTPRNRLAEAVLDKLGFPGDTSLPRRRDAGPGAFAVDFLHLEGSWPDSIPAGLPAGEASHTHTVRSSTR